MFDRAKVDSYAKSKELDFFEGEIIFIGFLQERAKDEVSEALGKCLSFIVFCIPSCICVKMSCSACMIYRARQPAGQVWEML